MTSIMEQSYSMFPRPTEEHDFMLYPDPPARTGYASPPLEIQYSPEGFGYPHCSGLENGAMYTDAPHYPYNGRLSPVVYADEGDMGLPSSNISSASAPSATSSTVGSPQSNHGQLSFVPEYGQNALGVNPSIVGQTDYLNGTEYSFGGPELQDFKITFDNSKPGFVGESTQISRNNFSLSHTPRAKLGSLAWPTMFARSACTTTPPDLAPALVSSQQRASSPVSPSIPRRKSTALTSTGSSNSLSFSECTAGSQWSEPGLSGELSPPTPYASFFSQSSSHFVAPLDSYSWSIMSGGQKSAEQSTNEDARQDPSLIHPEIRGPMGPPMAYENNTFSPQIAYPNSPALSGTGSPGPAMGNGSASPYMTGFQAYSPFPAPPRGGRRPSLTSFQSQGSQEFSYSGDESKEKQRCPHPDCGKTFKDLKAHMLTHQNERPEKCPIQTCDYHIKGFARKYDKNRHTLTHYKGTMVCGFCPGSGSAAEKSFNRADVFKRHLTAVHGVEQTPPNSRKKMLATANSGKKLTGYAPDATGKCSTCSATFSNAQDFYEHLDDCVLRIVQQEDPAEAINARRLREVENDREVYETLEKNKLPTTVQTTSASEDDEDDEMAEEDDVLDEDFQIRRQSSSKRKANPPNGVQKSRGMTHSRGGVASNTKKSRKNRRDYPSSWGFDKSRMTMKKRVLACFDGPRRLAKDEMMLSTEQEVRIKIGDGRAYVTDLDVQTMKRAEGFLSATDEEKGIWISDDPTEDDMKRMLAMTGQ
jgi:hypothetical protein